MSLIERAKSFMQRRARLIALTAVPLASLIAITPAKADGVTPLQLDPGGLDGCVIGSAGGTPSGSCTIAQALPGANGVTGVKLYGGGSVTSVSGSGVLTLGLSVTGGSTNGGVVSGMVPVSWNFTIGDTNPEAVLSWAVSLDVTGTLSGQVFQPCREWCLGWFDFGLAQHGLPAPNRRNLLRDKFRRNRFGPRTR